jgi:primosomal protein N' (replication factor Y) (superfamily II helicase)
VNRPAAASAPAPFASIVLTDPSLSHLGHAFTYRVPDGMGVRVGSVVRVPFRRRNRQGVVVELLDAPDVERTLDIKALLGPGLDPDVVGLCRWVAAHYLSTLGEALAAAVPERVIDEESRVSKQPSRPRTRSLAWLRAYRNGAVVERALSTSGRYAGFSWRPGGDRAGEIVSLAASAAARGKGVLVLLPEVRFSGGTADALRSLGDSVAWLGSDRSARDRYADWLAVRHGSKPIAVGGRAAVYAPVRDLALVIVDDEAHVSYKERRAPRINARAVASERARRAGAVFIASGTPPSIEAGAAVERGALTAVALTRGAARGRPPVTVVDRSGDGAGLVPHTATLRLCAAELAAGRRVVLLIHRAGDDARRAARRAFRILGPKRPARLDARTGQEELAEAVRHADCIVATPVIAKDLSIGRVGIVAILEADAALSVPEFRGAEEAFATWWHVGPWLRQGRIAIETAQPEHAAIRALVRWDPDLLYRWEASRRRETGYPPFAGLARIDCPPARAPAVASEVSAIKGLSALGPLERGAKAVVVARAPSRTALIEGLAPLVDAWRTAGEAIRVDVDPREVLP